MIAYTLNKEGLGEVEAHFRDIELPKRDQTLAENIFFFREIYLT